VKNKWKKTKEIEKDKQCERELRRQDEGETYRNKEKYRKMGGRKQYKIRKM
jgi:hypothetical protein